MNVPQKAMSPDIISFGEAILHLSPPPCVRLEEAHTFHCSVGGAESNTLACLARLGLETCWVSALPKNPLGKLVEGELRRHGVNTSHVVWLESHTRLGLFYTEETPNPLGPQVYYDRAHSACASLDPSSVDFSLVDTARILHLTGITPALSDHTREVFAGFLQRAREKGVPLSFDVNYRPKLWKAEDAALSMEEACQQASLLFCTRTDATALWGITGSAESMLRQMAQRFANNTVSKAIILTLSSEGSAQLIDNEYSMEPAFPTESITRFGSGDAFAAGYLYAYLGGQLYYEMQEQCKSTALTFGNALAALKRCIPGDIASITAQEVQRLLQRY